MCVGVCINGFCDVWVCVCVGFVMCGCVYKIYYTLYTIKLKICKQRFYYSSSKFSKFIQGKSPVLQ